MKISSKLLPITIGCFLTALFLWADLTENKSVKLLTERLEYLFYDFKMALLPKKVVSTYANSNPGIIIVDIDEKSLAQEGRWPWSREKIAELVHILFENQVAVLGFDIIFSEAQENTAKSLIHFLDNKENKANSSDTAVLRQALSSYEDYFDRDQQLANTFEGKDLVLGYLLHNEKTRPIGALGFSLMHEDSNILDKLVVPRLLSYTGNLPLLAHKAPHAGFTTSMRDEDGVIRRAPLILRFENNIYPSLSLAMAQLFLLSDQVHLQTHRINNQEQVEALVLGQISIPTDGAGLLYLPFKGARGQFPYLSAGDLLAGKVDKQSLQGKIVLLGTSALGLGELQSTAVDTMMPGVEIHANSLAAILEGRFLQQPVWTRGLIFTQIMITGLALSIFFPFLGPVSTIVLGSTVIAIKVGLNLWLWQSYGFILPIMLSFGLTLSLLLFNLSYGFLFENLKKRQITNMFGQYVSKALVTEMAKNPGSYENESKHLNLTVLFADIRHFTTISENLSAQDLKALLNRFFEPMTEIIFQEGGTIDKYVGDMIMAFWGAPLDDPHHARHALQAAIKMLEKTEELRKTFAELGLPFISIGIGLNTGFMNVGDMGSSYRRAYTVLGDAVNQASRIESLTKQYGCSLLVGEKTMLEVPDFLFRKVDHVQVKGKTVAINIYEPCGLVSEASEELLSKLAAHEAALDAYLKQDFDHAKILFEQVKLQDPQNMLADYFLKKIKSLEVR
jgi:adenylate cyclase